MRPARPHQPELPRSIIESRPTASRALTPAVRLRYRSKFQAKKAVTKPFSMMGREVVRALSPLRPLRCLAPVLTPRAPFLGCAASRLGALVL